LIGLKVAVSRRNQHRIQANNLEKAKQSAADIGLLAQKFFHRIARSRMEDSASAMTVLPQIARILRRTGPATMFIFCAGAITRRTTSCFASGTGKWCRMKIDALRPELYSVTDRDAASYSAIFPEAIANTLEIWRRCHLDLEFGCSSIRSIGAAREKREEYCASFVTTVCDGATANARRTTGIDSTARLRVRRFEKTGFVSYCSLLISFISPKEKGIPVGPDAALPPVQWLAYVWITDIDRFSTDCFRGFLNPDRVSPPDTTLIFAKHVAEKSSSTSGRNTVNPVAQSSRLANSKRKAWCATWAVMGLSYRRCGSHCKDDPNELNITLDSAVEKNPELKRAVATEPATRQLFEYAKILEGLSRNAGVHAAGVVDRRSRLV